MSGKQSNKPTHALPGKRECTMKLSRRQKALLKQIWEGIPCDICYSLSVVQVSGIDWTETEYGQFMEDSLCMGFLESYVDICEKHPGDRDWHVHSEEFEFGNPDFGSDPVPDHLLALIIEFGLNDFLAQPEVRMMDSASFDFDMGDSSWNETMTPEMSLKRDDFTIGRELLIEDDGILAHVCTWFDVVGKFSLDAYDDINALNMYAVFNPDNSSVRCFLLMDCENEEIIIDYKPTPEEIALIKEKMDVMCKRVHDCDLGTFWGKRTSSLEY